MVEPKIVAPKKVQEEVGKIHWEAVMEEGTTDVAQPLKGTAQGKKNKAEKNAERTVDLINKYSGAFARQGVEAQGKHLIFLNNREEFEKSFPDIKIKEPWRQKVSRKSLEVDVDKITSETNEMLERSKMARAVSLENIKWFESGETLVSFNMSKGQAGLIKQSLSYAEVDARISEGSRKGQWKVEVKAENFEAALEKRAEVRENNRKEIAKKHFHSNGKRNDNTDKNFIGF